MQLISKIDWERSGKQLGKNAVEVLDFGTCVHLMANNLGVAEYLQSEENVAEKVEMMKKAVASMEKRQDEWMAFKSDEAGQDYEDRLETAKKVVRTQENVARALSFSAAKPSSSSSGGDGDATFVFPELQPGVKEFTRDDRYDLASYQERLKSAKYKEVKLREKCGRLKNWVDVGCSARRGTARHNTVRHGATRCGTARNGKARHGGTAWRGKAQHGTTRLGHGKAGR